MRAFHNDPKVQAKYRHRVKVHGEKDQIIHGTYWERGKGCAVGCTIHGSDHMRYETELGIPVLIAHLEDAIFEGLDNGTAKDFPVRFLDAIPLGANLSWVAPKFFVWLLTSEEIGLPAKADERGRKAIADVAALWQRVVDGGEVREDEWAAAADTVADTAAWAAAYAAWAAAYAAWAAADTVADTAAWAATWSLMAEKLLSLLAEAPVDDQDDNGQAGRAGA